MDLKKLSRISDSKEVSFKSAVDSKVKEVFSSEDNIFDWVNSLLDKGLRGKGYARVYSGSNFYDYSTQDVIYFKSSKFEDAARAFWEWLIQNEDRASLARRFSVEEKDLRTEEAFNNFFDEISQYTKGNKGDYGIIMYDFDDVPADFTAYIGTFADVIADHGQFIRFPIAFAALLIKNYNVPMQRFVFDDVASDSIFVNAVQFAKKIGNPWNDPFIFKYGYNELLSVKRAMKIIK